MLKQLLVRFAPLTLLALAGCDQGGPPPVERSGYAAAMAAAFCGIPSCATLTAYEIRQCVTLAEQDYESELERRLASGGSYDAAAAGRCVADLRAIGAGGPGAAPAIAGDCNDVVTGQTVGGYACTVDATCVAGSFCDRSDSAHAYGICTKAGEHHRGSLGSACAGNEWYHYWDDLPETATVSLDDGTTGGTTLCHHAEGLTCDWTSRTCVPLPGPGQDCSTVLQCQPGSACNSVTGGGRVCELYSSPEPCNETCAPGQTCIDNQCTPRRPDGDACTWNWDCQSSRCGSGVCVSYCAG